MSDQIIELCKSVARLEEQVKAIAEDIREIKDNHIPHLQRQIEENSKFRIRTIAIVAGLVTVAELLIRIFIPLFGR
jgi:regulator of replication initiation timing